jgi:hypothetical protein
MLALPGSLAKLDVKGTKLVCREHDRSAGCLVCDLAGLHPTRNCGEPCYPDIALRRTMVAVINGNATANLMRAVPSEGVCAAGADR